MFAVIKTGGKQYKVAEGDILMVEKLDAAGETVTFDEVLLMVDGDNITLGKPMISGAKVGAKVLEAEGKGDKKMVYRYKAKTRMHKKKGHRQPYTKVQITKISL
jgi:large subunit ribosomal protein L21